MPSGALKALCRGALISLALLTPLVGNAAPVIYDNGGPNQASGNNMSFAYQAEDFVLASAFTVTDVHFWSLEASNAYRNGFYWALQSNAVGTPGAVVASGFQSSVTRTATGVSAFGESEFLNDFNIAPTVLAAGTYWLTLHNGAFSNLTDDGLDFLWETTAVAKGFNGHEDFGDGFGWNPNGNEHAFRLTGTPVGGPTVPEPGTAWLAGVALAGLLVRRLRSGRASHSSVG